MLPLVQKGDFCIKNRSFAITKKSEPFSGLEKGSDFFASFSKVRIKVKMKSLGAVAVRWLLEFVRLLIIYDR